jgi:hypothetical protein
VFEQATKKTTKAIAELVAQGAKVDRRTAKMRDMKDKLRALIRQSAANANEVHLLCTERVKDQHAINARVGYRLLPLPQDIPTRRGGVILKSDSKSTSYRLHTSSARSGGLETNRSRERIAGLAGWVAGGRFGRAGTVYWRVLHARKPPENVRSGRAGGGSGTGIQPSLNL